MEKKHSTLELGGLGVFTHKPVQSFRDLPIRAKVGIPVTVAIFILVFNHLLGFYYKDQQSDSDEWINAIARNQLQSQKIEYFLNSGDFTEENAINEIQIAIFQIEGRLNVLSLGGTSKLGKNRSGYIAQMHEELQPGLNLLKDQWSTYRSSIEEFVIKSEAITRSKAIYDDSVSLNRIQSLSSYLSNQEVLIKIQSLSEGFIRQGDALIEEIKFKSTEDVRTAQTLEIVFMVINVISILSVLTVITRYILHPVKVLAQTSRAIASGELDIHLNINSNDEIGEIAHATQILTDNLHEATNLTVQIGEGKYDTKLKSIDEDEVKENTLFGALLLMRQQLKKVSEEEKRRTWSTTGLTKFSELLRTEFKSFNEMANLIISELVQYIGGNQGGVFLLNDEDQEIKYLELIGCYAYGKKRFMTRKIKLKNNRAEGLLGQAYLEQDTIFLNDVPDKYVSITSGLGEATPNCVLIVPLKYNGRVEGVIELASFTPFEEYQVEFVEKLAASITSTIEATKRNEQTKKLLLESQIRTEEMRAQEEEMRQNVEELNATQEEMQRNETEMQQRLTFIKERETLAIEGKQQLETLLEKLPAMVYQILVRPSGIRDFHYVSDGIKNILGIKKEVFHGDATIINMIHPEDLGTFHSSLDNALEDLTLWKWEGRFIINETKTTWLATIARPELQEDGAVLFHGVFTDIENLFTNDEEIEQQHSRLEKFISFIET